MALIALILPDMRGGGAERITLELIRQFLEYGHEVDLVLMQAEGELMELVPDEARIVELGVSRFRDALIPIIRYLRRRKPDGIKASMWPLTAISTLAAKLARPRTNVVVSDHAPLSMHYAHSSRAMAELKISMRLLYPLANARVSVSRGTAADLARLSGLRETDFTVIYNPVPSPPEELPEAPDVEKLWGDAEHRLLTVGNLKNPKNYALLLRAFAQLPERESARLIIVGEGDLRPALEALAEELGIAERLIMPGFILDPAPYYRSADLFLLSSDFEGFGNVLVEAMHWGLPIVSTDCPDGPAEILAGGRFGKLVPCGDEKALAGAMSEALAKEVDPEVQRGRASEFSAPQAAQAYLALLLCSTAERTTSANLDAPTSAE